MDRPVKTLFCPDCISTGTRFQIVGAAGPGYDPLLKEVRCDFCGYQFFVLLHEDAKLNKAPCCAK